MTASDPVRPVVLCILDGWGHREERENNAVALAETPVWDRLMAHAPHALLDASGTEVGLPAGQMGNSEVGHMNIGAGRVVVQDLPRIDAAIADGRLAASPALARLIERLRASGGACHVMGLMSPGGVHAHTHHIAELTRLVAKAGIAVHVHAFLDGRDTPPRSALDYMRRFEARLADISTAPIATVMGRYWGMDRDRRWARSAKAYAVLVDGEGQRAETASGAIEASYAAGVSDEFVVPAALGAYAGMADGDGLVMANFRADRARQILAALLDPAFADFARARTVSFAAALGMVEYSAALGRFLEPIFAPRDLRHTLGEVVAEAGLRQLRVAETEKYAHVTFFLNGGAEAEFRGEERILAPSPRVATYDLKPEMSAPEVAARVVEAVGGFDLIVVNFANADMVGHTGKLEAAVRAIETVDACLGRILEAVESAGGALVITADHGNAEQMTDAASGQAHTAHTLNKVPLVLAAGPRVAGLDDGRLADIAPTVLALLGLPQPAEMTGRPLFVAVTEPWRRAAG
jgi:2,3-bisphosphoglycerate-independent phosphoglycerate mutase